MVVTKFTWIRYNPTRNDMNWPVGRSSWHGLSFYRMLCTLPSIWGKMTQFEWPIVVWGFATLCYSSNHGNQISLSLYLPWLNINCIYVRIIVYIKKIQLCIRYEKVLFYNWIKNWSEVIIPLMIIILCFFFVSLVYTSSLCTLLCEIPKLDDN